MTGSGLGQFGLTAVKTIPMKHLTMTDFHHNVINALDFHSQLNLTGAVSEECERCLDEGPPRKFTEDTVTGARLVIPDHGLTIGQLDWRYYNPEARLNILQ